ncbi:MAG: tetratricopeptide repeat protein [Nannocystaceae bacterium]
MSDRNTIAGWNRRLSQVPDDLQALTALAPLYGAEGRWREAIETLERKAEHLGAGSRRHDVLMEVATLWRYKLGDARHAADACRRILAENPSHKPATSALERLDPDQPQDHQPQDHHTPDLRAQAQAQQHACFAAGDLDGALDALRAELELTSPAKDQAAACRRVAQSLACDHGDFDRAARVLEHALTLAPSDDESYAALEEIFTEQENWVALVDTHLNHAEHTTDQPTRLDQLHALSRLFAEQLDDPDRARHVNRCIVEEAPDDLEAARTLAVLYANEGEHAAAAPLFARVLDPTAPRSPLDSLELPRLYRLAAQGADALQDHHLAQSYLCGAHELDPNDDETLLSLAGTAFNESNWEEAHKHYTELLSRHGDDAPDDVAALYEHLSHIRRQQHDNDGALAYAQQAVRVAPNRRQGLERLAELQSEMGDWEALARSKEALQEDGTEVAEIYRYQLDDPLRAIAAYDRALQRSPQDYEILHSLLELGAECGHWEEVVAVLDQIVTFEPDLCRRTKYRYAAALVVRDFIGDVPAARHRLEAVLDDDPGALQAFRAIDTMLTGSRDWSRLESAYRKMIGRTSADTHRDLRVLLLRNLAEVQRSRLGDYESAIASYEEILSLAPDNRDARVSVVELYDHLAAKSFETYAKRAVRQHQALVRVRPQSLGSYHALFDLFMRSGETDKAYCTATVLSLLRRASAKESQLLNAHHRGEFLESRATLSDAFLRRHVFSGDLDPHITAMFALVAPALTQHLAVPLPPAIRQLVPVDLRHPTDRTSGLISYVHRVLGTPTPTVYLQNLRMMDATLLSVREPDPAHPVLVLDTDGFKDRSRAHMVFSTCRELAALYPAFYLYFLLDRSALRLKHLVLACLRAGGLAVSSQSAESDQTAQLLAARLTPHQTQQLHQIARTFVEAGGTIDLDAWGRAVEASTLRCGLALCGDVGAAAHMISLARTTQRCRLNKREELKELIGFAVSEDFFATRRALGIENNTAQVTTPRPHSPTPLGRSEPLATVRSSASASPTQPHAHTRAVLPRPQSQRRPQTRHN